MTLQVGVGGSWKTPTTIKVGIGGNWKTVQQVLVGVGGAWKTAYSALSATASNVSATRTGSFGGSAFVTSSASPSTTVTGGSGNYTYLWELVDDNGYDYAPTTATSTAQNPTWSQRVYDGDTATSTWKVTVTDTTYNTTATATITLSMTYIRT